MFGNQPPKKEKDPKDKPAPDFSEEDKEDLKQDKPDTVILYPKAKDLVEKVIRIRKGR